MGYDPGDLYLVACAYNLRGPWIANSETGVSGHFGAPPHPKPYEYLFRFITVMKHNICTIVRWQKNFSSCCASYSRANFNKLKEKK